MEFEFSTANRIIFGPGKLQQVGKLSSKLGMKALIVNGIDISRTGNLLRELDDYGIKHTLFSINHEPSIKKIRDGKNFARSENCDLVISIGGGSAIDGGKAISAMLTNKGDLIDYLEVIGQGKPLVNPPVPFIAIPTTAGTGAEVTKNAVIYSPEHRVKVSLRHTKMLPDIALIDPNLTISLPPEITASTGLDALTQVIEPYVSKKANPITDSICREGIARCARSLRIAFNDGKNISARIDMSIVSLFGGLSLANSKLGAVHGIAGPFGGMFDVPHGAICARLLPFVMRENVYALKARDPNNDALYRYDEIAKLLTGNKDACAMDGVTLLMDMINSFGILPLSTYGDIDTELCSLIQKAKNASSMKGNPIDLTETELENIIRQAK